MAAAHAEPDGIAAGDRRAVRPADGQACPLAPEGGGGPGVHVGRGPGAGRHQCVDEVSARSIATRATAVRAVRSSPCISTQGETMSSVKEKLKAVAAAIAAIEKQFGKGAIMPLAGGEVAEIGTIPTGSIGVDLALGVGGLPRGRVVEIYGPESSGKTTLTLQAIAQAQRAGGVCAFIDAEHAQDVACAKKLGVRVEELLVSHPDCGEQALEFADMLVGTGADVLFGVDWGAALVPRAEIEGVMGDAHLGLQARLMSQA